MRTVKPVRSVDYQKWTENGFDNELRAYGLLYEEKDYDKAYELARQINDEIDYREKQDELRIQRGEEKETYSDHPDYTTWTREQFNKYNEFYEQDPAAAAQDATLINKKYDQQKIKEENW